MKIYEELSELFFERVMEEAIEQCAKEDGQQLMQTITSRNSSRKDKFYNVKYVIHFSFYYFMYSYAFYFFSNLNIFLYYFTQQQKH